eukprot:COSAG02_NODE_144_length_34086_cov_65.390944_13_plen_128_part_00
MCVIPQHGATLLAFALASMVKYGKLSLQAQALRSAAVRHSHAQLLRGSLGSWRKYVAKRRVKAAAETAALASYRARLLLHGCRRWLAGGLGRRTARVEVRVSCLAYMPCVSHSTLLRFARFCSVVLL